MAFRFVRVGAFFPSETNPSAENPNSALTVLAIWLTMLSRTLPYHAMPYTTQEIQVMDGTLSKTD